MEENTSYQSGTSGNLELQKFSNNIGSNIQKISQNVKSIKQLVNQLGTDQDNQQLRCQLHQVQHYTGGLAKDTNTELRTFQTAAVPAGQDAKAWRMQAERLTKLFTEALNDFQSAQRQAAAKEKDALKEAKAINDASYFDNSGNSSSLLELGGSSKPPPRPPVGGVSQMQLQLEQEELQGLQERESQIRQLEADIFDVNQIFRDLATMVHEQGGVVDSIEANVEVASQQVHQGATQLRQARQYQNKSRRKKVCILVWVVVVVSILITVIVLTSR